MAVTWENLECIIDKSVTNKLCTFLLRCGLCYKIKPPERILNNISGRIARGELVALMGPSGAGKSTLLNCLAQGKTYTGCAGKVTISGNSGNMRASYITQHTQEHLLTSLTVKQSLWYASQLKNPPSTTGQEHQEIINRLITELGLTGKDDTVVGRCSGGEMKRIAIGLELTAKEKPHFLFLDEPTSGLDSSKGYQIVQMLQTLASNHNMAVITVIHQPSYQLFALFNKCFVITSSGDFIYNGHPTMLVQTMRACGHDGMNIVNVADSIIEIAGSVTRRRQIDWNKGPSVDASETDTLVDVEEEQASAYRKVCEAMILHTRQEPSNPLFRGEATRNIEERGLCVNEKHFLSIAGLYATIILFLRTVRISLWKQKRLILIRCGLHLVVAGILVALYGRTIGRESGCVIIDPAPGPNNFACLKTKDKLRDEDAVIKNIKFQFFSLLFLMFASLMPTVLTFSGEVKIFLNEYRNGWYSCGSYYISKTFD